MRKIAGECFLGGGVDGISQVQFPILILKYQVGSWIY